MGQGGAGTGHPRRQVLNPGYQEHLGAFVKHKLLPPSPLPQKDRLDSPEAGKCCRVPKVGVKRGGNGGKRLGLGLSQQREGVWVQLFKSICN